MAAWPPPPGYFFDSKSAWPTPGLGYIPSKTNREAHPPTPTSAVLPGTPVPTPVPTEATEPTAPDSDESYMSFDPDEVVEPVNCSWLEKLGKAKITFRTRASKRARRKGKGKGKGKCIRNRKGKSRGGKGRHRRKGKSKFQH